MHWECAKSSQPRVQIVEKEIKMRIGSQKAYNPLTASAQRDVIVSTKGVGAVKDLYTSWKLLGGITRSYFILENKVAMWAINKKLSDCELQ